MEPTPKITCPKCGSDQLHADKKGFSGKKAVAGAILTGGLLGAAAGTIGSNKVKITCLNCGNVFRPGDHLKKDESPNMFKARDKFMTACSSGEDKYAALEELKKVDITVHNCNTPEEAIALINRSRENASLGCVVVIVILLVVFAFYAIFKSHK